MRALMRDSGGEGDFVLILKTAGLLVVLLFIIAAFFGGGMILVDQLVMPAYTSLGAEVELPDIVGKDFYEAKQQLEALDLILERIEENFHSVIEEGRIIEQTPPAFSKVKKGRTVGVMVSRGPEEIIIPDLTRLTQDQARAKLLEFGLILGRIDTRPDDTPEGTVIDQRPAPNVKSLRNTRVDLTVSSGPVTMTVLIPRLLNQGLNSALDTIRDMNGRVWIEWVEDDSQVMMTIIEQSPEPGLEVEGSPVFDLKVAIRTGFRPSPSMIDTAGIGALPPWMRRPPIIPPAR